MKKKFFERFEILSMAGASLAVLDKETNRNAFIHRTAFNHLDSAEDIRVVERIIQGRPTWWVEVLVWRAI